MQRFLTMGTGTLLLLGAGALALLFMLDWAVKAWRRRRFASAARALGLQLDEKGGWMEGVRGGITVRVVHELRETGRLTKRVKTSFFASDSDPSAYETVDDGPIERWFTRIAARGSDAVPRDLSIRSVGRLGRIVATVDDQPEWKLGARDVERAFDFDGDPPSREILRETLRQPEVLAALRALRSSPFQFALANGELSLDKRGRVTSPRALAVAVDSLVALDSALGDVRARVNHRSAEAVCAKDWKLAAAQHGLEVRGFTMSGTLPRARFSMVTELVDIARITRLELAFEPPLSLSLALAPAGAVDRLRALVGAEDVETGDAAFDGRFRVEGAPRERVLAILGSEVRAALTRLADRGALTVDAEHVSLVVPRLVVGDSARELVAIFGELATRVRDPAGELYR